MEKIVVNTNKAKMKVVFFSDVHVGSKGCDYAALARFNNFVKNLSDKCKKEDAFLAIVGLGDFIDAITIDDKRYMQQNTDESFELHDIARSQMKKFYELTKNVWEAGDVRIALAGNHELKFIQRKHFDVYRYLIEDLISAERAGTQAILRFILQQSTMRFSYDVFCAHGTGGGGWREGYGINVIYDISRYYYADCYVIGHLHRLDARTSRFMHLNNKHNIKYKEKHFGISGSFLNSYVADSYGYMEGRRGEPALLGFLLLDVWVENNFVASRLEKVIL